MKKLLISLLVVAISATTIQAKRTKIKIVEYTVKRGDSLSVIAKKHGTTTEEVRKRNGLKRGQPIKIGQIIKVTDNIFFPIRKKESEKRQTKRVKKKPAHKKVSKKKIVKKKITYRKSTKKTIKKGKVEYTIKAGDTLFIIARKHHTTVKEVREANDMEINALIKVGQKLQVPINTYFPDKKKIEIKIAKKEIKKEKIDYTIEKGDTLFTIARKHHSMVKDVRDANRMGINTMIRVGQVIKVPTNTYFPEKTVKKDKIAKKEEKSNGYYEVQGGDTLFSIAKKNHVSIKEIMTLNDMKSAILIKVGQKLKISKKSSFIASNKKVKKKKPVKHIAKMYKVKKGDTLSRIAKDNKISIKKLRALNKLGKGSRLKIGTLLAVGKTKAIVEKKPTRYRVRKGDTLWLIAKKHKTTVNKLRVLNKLGRRTKLRKGIVLVIDGKIKTFSKKRSKQRIAKNKKSRKTKIARITTTKKRKSDNKRLNDAMALLNGKGKKRSYGGNSNIIRTAKKYLGTRYVWGATGPSRFDCSGFTQYVLRKSKGARIPRVSRKQAYYGQYVSRRNLRAGDLVFFDTSRRRRGYVNHVGIYIGGSKFIHASSARHRVVITSLNRPFYSARFKWGRRVN